MLVHRFHIPHRAQLVSADELRLKTTQVYYILHVFAFVDMAEILLGQGWENQRKRMHQNIRRLGLVDATRHTGNGGRVQAATERRPNGKRTSHPNSDRLNKRLAKSFR